MKSKMKIFKIILSTVAILFIPISMSHSSLTFLAGPPNILNSIYRDLDGFYPLFLLVFLWIKLLFAIYYRINSRDKKYNSKITFYGLGIILVIAIIIFFIPLRMSY